MRDWARRPWVGLLLAYVAGPALVVGLLASVLAYRLAQVDVRVSGSVSLKVLAGNEFDYRLNAVVSDFETALASAAVSRAVDEAVTGSGQVRALRAERSDEASQVSVVLTASSEQEGRAALLAAGHTALRVLARATQRELLEEEQGVRRALQSRLAAGERLAAAPPETLRVDLVDPLRDARERAVDRSLADLAEVQGELAIVRELLAADLVPGVRVDEVVPLSPLGRALRTSLSGVLAAAVIGAVVLYARHGARLQGSSHRPGAPGRGRAAGVDADARGSRRGAGQSAGSAPAPGEKPAPAEEPASA